LESIAPVTSRTQPLIYLLGGMSVVGGILTVAVISQGVTSLLDSRALGAGATMLLAGGFGFVYLQLWQRNARLLVGEDIFGFQDILGRGHTWTASEVSAIVDVTILYYRRTAQRAIYVIGLDGRRLMALNPLAWSPSAVDRIARAAGKPVEVRTDPVKATAFRKEFPKAMSWFSAHSMFTGVLVALGLLVVVIAIPVFLVTR
jgi:hypothetical protein